MQALRAGIASLVIVVAIAGSATATASAPPVGQLPAGPVTAISVQHGELFGIALAQPRGRGQVWRVARAYNAKVVVQVSEGVQRGNVVVVYRARRPGRTTIAYALTVGETAKALQARTFRVTVRY